MLKFVAMVVIAVVASFGSYYAVLLAYKAFG